MRRLNLAVIIFILIIIPISLSSKAYSDMISVDLQLFIPDNGVIFLNDIDLTNISNAPLLLGITITNNYPDPKEIQLELGIKRNEQDIIKGMTYPFTIQPGVTYLTNRDLGINPDFSYTEINLGELEEIVYTTGKLPEGEYEFFVRILLKQLNVTEDSEILTISNPPTVLDLLSPGQPAENNNLMEIYTTFPFFLWHSNASKFRITVCEKLPRNTSPADVMNNEPRCQKTQEFEENFPKFFQYPSFGSRPLQPGKTYYWQIVAISESSDGPVELESEIWGFKINNLTGGTLSMKHQQLLAYLMTYFGGKAIADLFESGGELENFTFTGVMFDNDRPITMEDLNAIVEKIISGDITIANFFVE